MRHHSTWGGVGKGDRTSSGPISCRYPFGPCRRIRSIDSGHPIRTPRLWANRSDLGRARRGGRRRIAAGRDQRCDRAGGCGGRSARRHRSRRARHPPTRRRLRSSSPRLTPRASLRRLPWADRRVTSRSFRISCLLWARWVTPAVNPDRWMKSASHQAIAPRRHPRRLQRRRHSDRRPGSQPLNSSRSRSAPLHGVPRSIEPNTRGVPILMYHYIRVNPVPPAIRSATICQSRRRISRRR